MALTASEVRKLTSESLKGPVIEPIIDVIDNAIIEQAKNGNSSLHNPMQVGDLRKSFSLNADVEKAVRLHYESKGFKWVDHPDPDPGHPCSAPYTTLSW